MYDAPSAPPPKVYYSQPTSAPPVQQVSRNVEAETGHSLMKERQKLLEKYRDVADPRGKGTFEKLKQYLQYDQIEVNMDGNDNSQDNVYEGLLPEESVLMTLDCFIRQKRRSKAFICCCSFFSLGLYLVYLVCCMYCRPKKCGNTKVTLGLLSSGRLVYWHTDIGATKYNVPRLFNKDCSTYRRYFRMMDINMVQFKFQKRFDLFDENDADQQDFSARPYGHLRLFMGKFPTVTTSAEDWVTTPTRKLSVTHLQTAMAPNSNYQPPEDCFVKYGDTILRIYDAINLAYDIYVMIKGMLELSVVNSIKFFFLFARNVLNAYRLALYGAVDPLDNVDTHDRCIDVYVHDDDEFAKESTDGVYLKMMEFQKKLIMVRGFTKVVTCAPVNEPHWHMCKGNPGPLLKRVSQTTGQDQGITSTWELGTSSVGIHESEVPLVPGEYVVDAYGEFTRWSATDILQTIVTLGLFYLMYLRREFLKHKAVIITNMRVIQVKKAGELRNRLPMYSSIVYDFDVKWWSLEGTYAGLVNQSGLTATGEIATKQGVIKVTLSQMRKHFFSRITLDSQVQHRFRVFLFAASGAKTGAVVNNPQQYGLSPGQDPRAPPNMPSSLSPLMTIKGESVLAQFSNENLYKLYACGSCTKYLFCGFRPVNLDGDITVSTHRYLVKVHPHFNPFCCGMFFVTEEFMWLWGKLETPKNFQGWSLQGRVHDHTVLCDSCHLCMPWRRRQHKYSIVDFVLMAYNTRPVQLRMLHWAQTQGHLEEPRVKLMRDVMTTIMAAPRLVEDDITGGEGRNNYE
eukprot:CAMPEP_0196588998 /NCGR_PEP_ID=MMETSP1081-20130531/62354_1 /TAXON_ID=36882 /ORGANISM="Pyramimonas amylifera, Strain CCMP720" /LENGTH=792 /DNA_ID=CAMNT_0041911665 /DNA_START=342 /DNA_END=2720 /DNA_ORIENTATION=+